VRTAAAYYVLCNIVISVTTTLPPMNIKPGKILPEILYIGTAHNVPVKNSNLIIPAT